MQFKNNKKNKWSNHIGACVRLPAPCIHRTVVSILGINTNQRSRSYLSGFILCLLLSRIVCSVHWTPFKCCKHRVQLHSVVCVGFVSYLTTTHLCFFRTIRMYVYVCCACIVCLCVCLCPLRRTSYIYACERWTSSSTNLRNLWNVDGVRKSGGDAPVCLSVKFATHIYKINSESTHSDNFTCKISQLSYLFVLVFCSVQLYIVSTAIERWRSFVNER